MSNNFYRSKSNNIYYKMNYKWESNHNCDCFIVNSILVITSVKIGNDYFKLVSHSSLTVSEIKTELKKAFPLLEIDLVSLSRKDEQLQDNELIFNETLTLNYERMNDFKIFDSVFAKIHV